MDRDRELPPAHILVKGLRFGASLASAPLYLLGCDRVGAGARTRGRPLVDNAGHIEIGERVVLNSMFSPVELAAGPRGRVEIGDDAAINYGTVISAEREVPIGDRIRIGPYVRIADSDGDIDGEQGPRPITIGDDVQFGPNVQLLTPTHPVEPEPRRKKWEAARPIRIGNNVWLGGGAIVLPGVTIGDNTVVGAGSVVTRDLPANVVAVGNPARVIRALDGAVVGSAPARGETRG